MECGFYICAIYGIYVYLRWLSDIYAILVMDLDFTCLTVSPFILLRVRILSSAPVIRRPSAFQSPVRMRLLCFPMHGIMRCVFLLKNIKEPFSVPNARTECVFDHDEKDTLSFAFPIFTDESVFVLSW